MLLAGHIFVLVGIVRCNVFAPDAASAALRGQKVDKYGYFIVGDRHDTCVTLRDTAWCYKV